jgi:hypothetical protein
VSPWLIECDEPVEFMCVEPTWTMVSTDEVTVLPGILDYKYQHATNINMLLKRKDADYKLMFELNTPMMQLVPLDNRPVELKIHFDPQEYNKKCRLHTPLKSFNWYHTNKKLLQQQEKRCPFGFGK